MTTERVCSISPKKKIETNQNRVVNDNGEVETNQNRVVNDKMELDTKSNEISDNYSKIVYEQNIQNVQVTTHSVYREVKYRFAVFLTPKEGGYPELLNSFKLVYDTIYECVYGHFYLFIIEMSQYELHNIIIDNDVKSIIQMMQLDNRMSSVIHSVMAKYQYLKEDVKVMLNNHQIPYEVKFGNQIDESIILEKNLLFQKEKVYPYQYVINDLTHECCIYANETEYMVMRGPTKEEKEEFLQNIK